MELLVVTIVSTAVSVLSTDFLLYDKSMQKRCFTITYTYKNLEEVFLGSEPTYTKWAYQMNTDLFYKLHDKLFLWNSDPLKNMCNF